MIFTETDLVGAYLIEPEPIEDERGHFARVFCKREFLDHGLNTDWVQSNISYSRYRGTVRGMHFQVAPAAEIKMVSCVKGQIYDVIVDLRSDSASYGKWLGFTLTEDNQHALYVPAGYAHGFQTLTDDAKVFYQMSQYYAPDCARGVRWDDPTFDIQWPLSIASISPRDLEFPRFVL